MNQLLPCFTLMSCVALSACAGPDMTAPPLSIAVVHEVPGQTKQAICNKARQWAALAFKDSKAVVEVFDPEQGKLIGKGRVVTLGYAGTPFPIDFTMVVDCKDGRYRTTYDGFMAQSQYGPQPLREDPMNNLRTKTEARIRELDVGLLKEVTSTSGADF